MDPKELRKFATECLQLALSAGSAEEAARLRTMAREMLDQGGTTQRNTVLQQQQQIQPEKKEGDVVTSPGRRVP